MNLREETYEHFDKIKQTIPSIEIRFMSDACHVYIKGVSKLSTMGADDFIDNCVDSFLMGVLATIEYKSLKDTLGNL